MNKIEQNLLFVLGVVLLAFGAYIVVGWFMVNPAMVRIVPNSTNVVFNTAVCFIMTGSWFILRVAYQFTAHRYSKEILKILDVLLFLLPAAALIEIILHVDLGIDLTRMHALILDKNPAPGRMAPNTCIGFLFVSMAFFASELKQSRSKKQLLYILSGLVFIIGMSSLISYVMELEWLYTIVSLNRMAIPTSIAMTLLSIGILITARTASNELPQYNKRQDIRLTTVAAIILTLLALTSGLAGFVVLKNGTNEFLENELLQKGKNTADYMEDSLRREIALTDELLSFPVFKSDLETLPQTPNDTAVQTHLGKVMDILLNLGFSGAELENADHINIFSRGTLTQNPDLIIPVKVDGRDVSLLWDKGLSMRIERHIMHDGIVIGRLITEQKMDELNGLLNQLRFSARTSDVGVCHRDGDMFECFPSRLVPHMVRVNMFKDGQPAFPMTHALLGETGVIYANDIRGIPVLAAYAPVGQTGVGLVVKIETVEFYGFIRHRLNILFAVLISLIAIGIYMLWMQLQPVASRLVQSEQRALMANKVLEADTDRLNQIIAIQQKIARAPFDLNGMFQIIVDSVQELTNSAGAAIELIDGDELSYRAAGGAFASFVNYRLKMVGSLSGVSISSHQVINCYDTEADPRTDKVACRKLNIGSMIVSPLLHEGKVIGVLKTAATQTNAFTVKDEQAVQLLSSLIGPAISHQQDFEEKQRLFSERAKALEELHKTTDYLRVSEERTRIIIESAHDAFIGTDGRGKITDWNTQAQKVFGWSREEVLGKSMIELVVSPVFRLAFSERLSRALSPDYRIEENTRFEINVNRRTKEELVVELTLSPIRTSGATMLAVFLHDITERKQIQEKLTHMAQFDALTGLPNRALFMDRLNVAVLRVARAKKAMALMFLDLDGFKAINDNYGHQAGDKVLKDFAARLTHIVRGTDTVARLAGDEFTIILENLSDPENDARAIANKIIAGMGQPFDLGGENKFVTTSIGITISNTGSQNVDVLIREADAEMYKAKHQGKNQFSLARQIRTEETPLY